MTVHSSFLALSQAEIEAHVDELVAEHIDGAERARVLGYLNQTLAKDKAKVRGYRSHLHDDVFRVDLVASKPSALRLIVRLSTPTM